LAARFEAFAGEQRSRPWTGSDVEHAASRLKAGSIEHPIGCIAEQLRPEFIASLIRGGVICRLEWVIGIRHAAVLPDWRTP
jgi:hypothetical protein